MLELRVTKEVEHDSGDDSPRLKEARGLLRRAFSSKRRKKKKDFVTNLSPRGSTNLYVSTLGPAVCPCLLGSPFPGGYTMPAGSPTPGSPGYHTPSPSGSSPGVFTFNPGSPGR